jgi:uncharacterized membrane protein YjjB (DUF3815 family)
MVKWKVDPESEAQRLEIIYPGEAGFSKSLDIIRHQFDVIQARSQLLLTVGTLALTITGFSGPAIARSGVFARYSMTVGIVFVLAALIVLLTGGLRIQWMTQFVSTDRRQMLIDIIQYRDQKTTLYMIELSLLVIGLSFYVASVVAYLINA